VLGIVLISYLVFLAVLSFIGGSYWSLVGGKFGDNPGYLAAASAIRHWTFSGVDVKQFWGVSYAVACVSLLTGASEGLALVVVCVGASLASVALCYWLWDGWIAVFFALLSLDWFQRSLLGGAEPLFMALLLGSFLALRRDRWVLAVVLGSLATVVRPFGVFALVGLGVLCSKDPVGRRGIQAKPSDELLRLQSDILPDFAPLLLCPVVIGQRDSEPGVAHPVHEAQTRSCRESFAEMIFDKDVFPGHPPGFPLQNTGIDGVVQNIGEQHHIKGRVFKRKMMTVKHLYRDVSVFAN
jgi:hypothetical protein